MLDKNVRVIGIGEGEKTGPNRIDVKIQTLGQLLRDLKENWFPVFALLGHHLAPVLTIVGLGE